MPILMNILCTYYNYIDTILVRSSDAKLKIFHKVMFWPEDK